MNLKRFRVIEAGIQNAVPEPMRKRLLEAPLLLLLAALIAYHNSFAAPFVFDDFAADCRKRTDPHDLANLGAIACKLAAASARVAGHQLRHQRRKKSGAITCSIC